MNKIKFDINKPKPPVEIEPSKYFTIQKEFENNFNKNVSMMKIMS